MKTPARWPAGKLPRKLPNKLPKSCPKNAVLRGAVPNRCPPATPPASPTASPAKSLPFYLLSTPAPCVGMGLDRTGGAGRKEWWGEEVWDGRFRDGPGLSVWTL